MSRSLHTVATVAPRLCGRSDLDHVALTFDDGPDPASTPHFLDLLERHDVRATFFLLGRYVAAHPDLVRRMHAGGHELAVHGWDHTCVAFKRPGVLRGELTRTADLIEALTGSAPRRYRPPYGVLTLRAGLAARRSGLEVVLWTAWGRDWSRRATPDSVVRLLDRGRPSGGTLLLHDTDRTSAPGSWRTTLAATEVLLARWRADGTSAGPLREHWSAQEWGGRLSSASRKTLRSPRSPTSR